MMTNKAKLEKIMLQMGYSEHLTGTRLLRQAVAMYQPGMRITKELYPALAAATGGTASRVERALRHATSRTFDFAGVDSYQFFGNAINPRTGVPTNEQVISRLEYLCREDEAEREPNT